MAFTYTYKWSKDNNGNGVFSDISGATAPTYTPIASDVGSRLRVIVTATGVGGQSTQVSNTTNVVTANTGAPTYLPSVARVRDRIAAGGRVDEAEITTMGVEAYIRRQLNPAALNDAQARKYTSWPDGFRLIDYTLTDAFGPQALHVARMAGRRDGLKAQMHEFWVNHFVVGYLIRNTPRLGSLSRYDQDMYYGSLGNFKSLLTKFIMSVPLQYFMDNYLNVYGNVNENLGREVLELFALGIGETDETPHYDQIIDVAELTRLLTGHGVKITVTGDRIDNDPGYITGQRTGPDTANPVVLRADGAYVFNFNTYTSWFYKAKHDPDRIAFTFFPGVEFSNAVDGAGKDGYDVHPSLAKFITLMSKHPPSARFMCDKIAKWFLGCKPRAATRQAMIDVWIAQSEAPDQISQVLWVLFTSEDFCTDFCTGKRSLTPMTWYSKILNYFGEDYVNGKKVSLIKTYCEKEGYNTTTYQTPAGYPDDVDYWLSPGHLTERSYWTNFMLPLNNSGQYDFAAAFTQHCKNKGFNTPRDLLNDVNHYLLCDRATTAQMNDIGVACFGSNLDAVTNWDTNDARLRVGNVFRTVIMVDIAHFAV